MAPQCEVVQFMAHPACDGGVSLSLRDEVAQQGVCAEKVKADVCGLCKVSQHRRVGEVFGTWPSVDQRHHNLHSTAFISHRFIFDI